MVKIVGLHGEVKAAEQQGKDLVGAFPRWFGRPGLSARSTTMREDWPIAPAELQNIANVAAVRLGVGDADGSADRDRAAGAVGDRCGRL